MAIFTANKPTKIMSIHKQNCPKIPWEHLHSCGCGETGLKGNQIWFCEEHITLEEMNDFMNQRFWAVLLCDICFKEK